MLRTINKPHLMRNQSFFVLNKTRFELQSVEQIAAVGSIHDFTPWK